MEKEVTTIDVMSLICDKVYNILFFIYTILIANYVVRGSLIVYTVLIGLFLIVIKSLLGLYNFSFFKDVLHYYCDLFSKSIMGWLFGVTYCYYITGVFHSTLLTCIIWFFVAMVLIWVKGKVQIERNYYDLFK